MNLHTFSLWGTGQKFLFCLFSFQLQQLPDANRKNYGSLEGPPDLNSQQKTSSLNWSGTFTSRLVSRPGNWKPSCDEADNLAEIILICLELRCCKHQASFSYYSPIRRYLELKLTLTSFCLFFTLLLGFPRRGQQRSDYDLLYDVMMGGRGEV